MTIPAEEFRGRQRAILDACSDLELDALIVVSNGSCFGLSGRSQGYMAFLAEGKEGIAAVPGHLATPQLSATLRPKGGVLVNIRLPSTW